MKALVYILFVLVNNMLYTGQAVRRAWKSLSYKTNKIYAIGILYVYN